MVYVRHANRYVRASIEKRIEDILRTTGWLAAPAPFNTSPVKFLRQPPAESDLKPATSNSVYVSFGMQAPEFQMELGGGVIRVEHAFFVDALAVNDSVALAIASDIQDGLLGRADGSSSYLRPTNPGTKTPLPGYLGEFTEAFMEVPRSGVGSWQSIKATLTLDQPGAGS